MDYVISAWDREWFKRCRRAWDLGSPSRQNYEPVVAPGALNLGQAIDDALAVYYYPGMWDWDPAIVRPLTIKAFLDSMNQQRGQAGAGYQWEEQSALGEGMLEHYFEWAPLVDRFSPLQVATEYIAAIADPLSPESDLTTVDSGAVRYRGRIHLFVVDEEGSYWLVQHRVVDGAWDDIGLLSLDDRAVASCWAWERFGLMTLAGVIFNELQTVLPRPDQRVGAGLSERRRRETDRKRGSVAQNRHRPRPLTASRALPEVEQQGNAFFRRTQLPVSRERVGDLAARIGFEALDMMSDGLRLYPDPVPENCSRCHYREPCLAMNEGAGIGPILEAGYRQKPARSDQPRLGGLFGLNPNQLRVREYNKPRP